MFCPECGAPQDEDAIFCGNCGAVLTSDEIPEAVEVQADELEQEIEFEVEPEEDLPEFLAEIPTDEPLPPPPPRPVAAAPSVPTSGMAIASLVLGIGGLTVLPLLGSILALIFGYLARKDIRERPAEVTGDGLAVAGIVMGWISVALAVAGLLFFGVLTVCGVCGAFGASSY